MNKFGGEVICSLGLGLFDWGDFLLVVCRCFPLDIMISVVLYCTMSQALGAEYNVSIRKMEMFVLMFVVYLASFAW